MYRQRRLREDQDLGEGGEKGPDNDLLNTIFDRAGAYIMGRRMFDEGEPHWPEDLFGDPVFVLTHEQKDSWNRGGPNVFHFINDGIQSALERAREVAGEKDVRISGGAETLRQFLEAGALDEGIIHLSPILLGRGVRLFENLDPGSFSLEIEDAVPSERVIHLFCKVNK